MGRLVSCWTRSRTLGRSMWKHLWSHWVCSCSPCRRSRHLTVTTNRTHPLESVSYCFISFVILLLLSGRAESISNSASININDVGCQHMVDDHDGLHLSSIRWVFSSLAFIWRIPVHFCIWRFFPSPLLRVNCLFSTRSKSWVPSFSRSSWRLARFFRCSFRVWCFHTHWVPLVGCRLVAVFGIVINRIYRKGSD